MSLEELSSKLTEEQKEKAMACKSAEELVEFLESQDIELSPDELEAAAGGFAPDCDRCIKVTIWDT